MEKELEKYLSDQGWYLTAEKALDLTEHVLIFLTDKMVKDEPYAVKDIEALKSARDNVVLALED